jgi:hypothetical protein
MKSMLRNIDDHGVKYQALMFVCPGCASVGDKSTGLHILPVNTNDKSPSWNFDGNLEAPTLTPSILTGRGTSEICHSFLRGGVFNFLTDSTHPLSGQQVPIPDLPDWVTQEQTTQGDSND